MTSGALRIYDTQSLALVRQPVKMTKKIPAGLG